MLPIAPLIDHQQGRKTTWFELFFDLTFVIAVASLVSALADDYTFAGAGQFAFLFLVLWWLWLGQAFLYSRFDRDVPSQRALGLAQMVAVIAMAHGAADPLRDGLLFLSLGAASFKVFLAIGYLRERHRPGLAPLCHRYAFIYCVQALLWAASPLVGSAIAPFLWALALLLDLATPFLMLRETPRAPPHSEHLPERFGLFTLIVLGETAVACLHILDHGAGGARSAAFAVMGLGLGFLFWLGYFDRARGGQAREVSDKRFRMWAYGHLPLLLGLASLGAGLRVLASSDGAPTAAPWLFAIGVSVAMVGVTVESAARSATPLRQACPHLLLAVLVLAVPALASAPLATVGTIATIAAAQLLTGKDLRGAGHHV